MILEQNSKVDRPFVLSISPGDTFKPILWRADYDMDFSSGCLYCGHSEVKGYSVVDERGNSGKVAVCTECSKVNAKY